MSLCLSRIHIRGVKSTQFPPFGTNKRLLGSSTTGDAFLALTDNEKLRTISTTAAFTSNTPNRMPRHMHILHTLCDSGGDVKKKLVHGSNQSLSNP